MGSVKTNIGHLEVSAGIAGVIKVLLAIHYQTLPASLNFQELNPSIDLEGSPFYIVKRSEPWKAVVDETGGILPRRAGVNSFGFGGVNAHVILEEHIPTSVTSDDTSSDQPQVVVLSAKSKDRLRAYAEKLKRYLEDENTNRCPSPNGLGASLSDLAYTLQVGREAMSASAMLGFWLKMEFVGSLIGKPTVLC